MASSQNGMANKFKFRDIIPGIDRYQRLANAIDWLITAELVIKIPIVNFGESPLKAYTKEAQFKLLVFDVGILGSMLRYEIEFLFESETGVIPLEIKSGSHTRSESLKKFADKYHPPYSVIMSANNLLIDVSSSKHWYPLYLASQFPLSTST